MISQVVAGVAGPLFALVDNLFTSDEERDKAKLQLLKMQQDGKLKEVELQMSAILSESQSKDPWTSRARPCFLYVIYIFILAAIPMGIVSAFDGEMAQRIATGVEAWLKVIPESMWGLFGVGYLGYTGARSWDKSKGTAK